MILDHCWAKFWTWGYQNKEFWFATPFMWPFYVNSLVYSTALIISLPWQSLSSLKLIVNTDLSNKLLVAELQTTAPNMLMKNGGWAIQFNQWLESVSLFLSDLSQSVRVLDSVMECAVVWVQCMYLLHEKHITNSRRAQSCFKVCSPAIVSKQNLWHQKAPNWNQIPLM